MTGLCPRKVVRPSPELSDERGAAAHSATSPITGPCRYVMGTVLRSVDPVIAMERIGTADDEVDDGAARCLDDVPVRGV